MDVGAIFSERNPPVRPEGAQRLATTLSRASMPSKAFREATLNRGYRNLDNDNLDSSDRRSADRLQPPQMSNMIDQQSESKRRARLDSRAPLRRVPVAL